MAGLQAPSVAYRETFLAGAADFHAHGQLGSTYAPSLGYDLSFLTLRFDRFVADLRALSRPGGSGGRRYPDHVLWMLDGDEYTGQASIRPRLANDYLLTYGGHVGYSIRPSRRHQGLGTQILCLTLAACRSLGLTRVLITCDSDNAASRRIIERNGGRFEIALPMTATAFRSEGRSPVSGISKLRYWIPLPHEAKDGMLADTDTAPATSP